MTAPGYFVTATDTGVGKTQVACALLRALVRAGHQPHAFKPYESGVDARRGPTDARALQRAAGGWQPLDEVCPCQLAPPLAPGIAARQLSAAARRRHQARWPSVLAQLQALRRVPAVVEGAGGLFVPLDDTHDVVDLLVASRLPAVVVARAGLGTLNHTALTLEALARRRVPVIGLVLNQAAGAADLASETNAAALRRRHAGLRIVGPVPYVREGSARARVFDDAVAALLAPGSGTT